MTFYSNEKESLLSPGTQLKVKSNKFLGMMENDGKNGTGECSKMIADTVLPCFFPC